MCGLELWSLCTAEKTLAGREGKPGALGNDCICQEQILQTPQTAGLPDNAGCHEST